MNVRDRAETAGWTESMPVTNYYTVNGEIISEVTDGVRLDYLTDALGSVTAKVDQNCNVVSTARYKPYGDLLSGTQYKLGWVGSQGYRSTGLKYSGEYVRARHFSIEQGQWTTRDSLWPIEPANSYVYANATTFEDRAGTAQTQAKFCCCCPESVAFGQITKFSRLTWLGVTSAACGDKVEVPYKVTLKDYPGIKGEIPCGLSWKEDADTYEDDVFNASLSFKNREQFSRSTSYGNPTFLEWFEPPLYDECSYAQGKFEDWPHVKYFTKNPLGSVHTRKMTLTITVTISRPELFGLNICSCAKKSVFATKTFKFSGTAGGPSLVCTASPPDPS